MAASELKTKRPRVAHLEFFKSIFGCSSDSNKDEFTEAHLGEASNFYYDEKRKRWVTRGEEPENDQEQDGEHKEEAKSTETAPPPPPPAASSCATRSEANRRPLTSGDLYTHIPGIELTTKDDVDVAGEAKDALGGSGSTSPVAQVPQAPKSHFTPRQEPDAKDSALDQQLYDELLACNLNPSKEADVVGVADAEDAKPVNDPAEANDAQPTEDHQFTDPKAVQGGALNENTATLELKYETSV